MQTPDPMQSPFQEHPGFQADPFGQQSQQGAQDDGITVPHSTGQYPMQNAQFPGRSQPQPFQAQYQEQDPGQAPGVHPRDVELILAKLDAIKSELDALHQRVRKIEQASETGQQKKYW